MASFVYLRQRRATPKYAAEGGGWGFTESAVTEVIGAGTRATATCSLRSPASLEVGAFNRLYK